MDIYLYLLLNLLTISFPLFRSFENRIQYYKNWYALFPGILVTGAFFLIWDHWFTVIGVWEFNPRYILGIYFFELPLEEWLFFLTVPFACVFIYEVLKYFVPKDIFAAVAKPITFVLIVLFVLIGVLNLDKWYTSVNFIVAAVVLSIHYIVLKTKFLGRFYLTYLVSLIPFLLVNGVLTGSFIDEPVVKYNDMENLSIRLFTIPIEDTVYSMTLLLMTISIYELIKSKKTIKPALS
ncbi:lycopene cyclase domain protein [Belliella baltica DSM 15883]|uniref:Lycopene cyclase domain protein n=1 Tax=Belliella baltica (strain DSM 15883 / CIP 108006 / LMG 21964 / BA134) TaxID=866536 RepID=I3Z2M7_BELBD|nr:lycopene cyclase domain-containing protein [Belliella baltica]AFL83495.1 lycopene cyclase domain protein [Belliella baltica DSM 15883]